MTEYLGDPYRNSAIEEGLTARSEKGKIRIYAASENTEHSDGEIQIAAITEAIAALKLADHLTAWAHKEMGEKPLKAAIKRVNHVVSETIICRLSPEALVISQKEDFEGTCPEVVVLGKREEAYELIKAISTWADICTKSR